jgi:hypothetical protein
MRMARRALKGMGRIYRRGTSWWLDYTEAGVRHRHPLRTPDGEPCRTRQEAEAERRRHPVQQDFRARPRTVDFRQRQAAYLALAR